MLNNKIETFLVLCKTGSFSRAAERLHITQPAVSMHIKALEAYYGGKLFLYEGRRLSLTKRGKMLYDFASTMFTDSLHIHKILNGGNFETRFISLGATRTIGEYVMPPLLGELIKAYPDINLKMTVDNTEILFSKLRDGELDFLVIEGYFNKADFSVELFSQEEFVGLCSPSFFLKDTPVCLDELTRHRLILREHGSGTRDILAHILNEHNLSIDSFSRTCDVSNMRAIKELTADGLGITFMYKAAATEEIAEGRLSVINLQSIDMKHEFNFVCAKNSISKNEYFSWFDFFRKTRERLLAGCL